MSAVPAKILLVEDNPNDEELTLMALEGSGFAEHVFVARDGSEALDYLFSRGVYSSRVAGQLPVVMFLDLKLPKFNGIEVLREVRRHQKTKLLPVVILTSSQGADDRLQGYMCGANSYVRKLVDFAAFCQMIEQISRYWLTVNEPSPILGD